MQKVERGVYFVHPTANPYGHYLLNLRPLGLMREGKLKAYMLLARSRNSLGSWWKE